MRDKQRQDNEQATPSPRRPSRAKAAMKTSVQTRHELLDVRDLAALMKANERTIERMIEAGEFPRPFQLRTESKRPAYRWTREQYERWAQRRQQESEQQVA